MTDNQDTILSARPKIQAIQEGIDYFLAAFNLCQASNHRVARLLVERYRGNQIELLELRSQAAKLSRLCNRQGPEPTSTSPSSSLRSALPALSTKASTSGSFTDENPDIMMLDTDTQQSSTKKDHGYWTRERSDSDPTGEEGHNYPTLLQQLRVAPECETVEHEHNVQAEEALSGPPRVPVERRRDRGGHGGRGRGGRRGKRRTRLARPSATTVQSKSNTGTGSTLESLVPATSTPGQVVPNVNPIIQEIITLRYAFPRLQGLLSAYQSQRRPRESKFITTGDQDGDFYIKMIQYARKIEAAESETLIGKLMIAKLQVELRREMVRVHRAWNMQVFNNAVLDSVSQRCGWSKRALQTHLANGHKIDMVLSGHIGLISILPFQKRPGSTVMMNRDVYRRSKEELKPLCGQLRHGEDVQRLCRLGSEITAILSGEMLGFAAEARLIRLGELVNHELDWTTKSDTESHNLLRQIEPNLCDCGDVIDLHESNE